jgi:hypothetical protein
MIYLVLGFILYIIGLIYKNLKWKNN